MSSLLLVVIKIMLVIYCKLCLVDNIDKQYVNCIILLVKHDMLNQPEHSNDFANRILMKQNANKTYNRMYKHTTHLTSIFEVTC